MDPVTCYTEGLKVALKLGVQIKINLKVIFFQNFTETFGVKKLHIVSEVGTVFKCFI